MKQFLTNEQRIILEETHRCTKEKRSADRIKSIMLLNMGWNFYQVAEALFIDVSTIYQYLHTYQNKGLDNLLKDDYKGGNSKLSKEQESKLKEHLQDHVYSDAKSIAKYIEERFEITYTSEGLVHLLHRLGFVYKKSKHIPGKADPDKQREFIKETYQRIKEEKGTNDKIYFMDGTHPCHNSMPSYGWIPKGKVKELPSNTGRKRININGAINISDLDFVYQEDETINADSTINLLAQLEKKNPNAEKIYVITDNARYNHSKKVEEYTTNSKIHLIFLPTYAPNLNLIERLWKFFHKKVLYNSYYSTFDRFKQACINFFENILQYKDELNSLLTENFQIIGHSVLET